MRMLGVAAAMLWLASAAAAIEAGRDALRFGTLALPFDPAEWRIERSGAGGAEIGHVERRDVSLAIALNEPDAACSFETERDRLGPHVMWSEGQVDHIAPVRLDLPGLVLHGATMQLGCRNWASQPLGACVRHAGVTHRFDFTPDGCAGGPQGEELVLDLLRGLQPAE